MRFSSTALLALPVLAAAAESPFEQYKAKFQNFLSNLGASAPLADKAADTTADAAGTPSAATAKGGKTEAAPKPIATLTLEGWKDTLYAPVQADATKPEEWLVLVSGRNKTCYGHCARIEEAFTEAASKFGALPASESPQHLGYVNCDDQPVLCNTWSANTGALWLFEMLPQPAPIDIHTKRLNLTTVTSQDVVDAYTGRATGEVKFNKIEGYFHPFDGVFAQYGLAVPLGYFFWALNALPSWAMMLVVSFISRTMMNRRVEGMNRPGNPAGAGAAPRAAPPGDGRS